MTVSETRVWVVDDDPSVRKSLLRLLKLAGYAAEACASAAEFLRAPPRTGPACLVLDVHMPELGGLQLQHQLAATADFLPIIFITGNGDIPTSVRAIKSGAVDFLIKPFDPEALLRAVEEALARSGRAADAQRQTAQVERCFARLTPREREVLALVVTGRSNKKIAADLGIVEQTVKIHRGRVMRKMQVESVAELVRRAELLRVGKSPRA